MKVDTTKLRQLLKAADGPPPWTIEGGIYIYAKRGMIADRMGGFESVDATLTLALRMRGFGRGADREANLRLVVEAVNALPALLDDVDRLRAKDPQP
jgi:hypothetical protein